MGGAPVAGVPQDVTLVEVLAELSGLGYTTEFFVHADGRLCCRVCGVCAEPSTVEVELFRRLEGASDPSDMAAVVAVRCRACGGRGLAVVRYGPEAGPGEAAFLSGLVALTGTD
ncbi:MAG: hypothetical protein ACT452_10150 [Microthrixaceae bacterium]